MDIPETIVVDKEQFKHPKSGWGTTAQRRANGVGRAGSNGRVPGRKRVHYTDKQKMEAACAFAVTGNSRRVAELTKISEATIRGWKCTDWWNEIQDRIVREQDEELDVKLTKLVDKAVLEVNDRLDNGDYVYNPKTEKLSRKPINARDLAIVTAITIDKRELLRGKPTSRVERVSTDERLGKLKDQFKAFANAKEITQEVEVLDDNEE